jgi:hypothetical protein
MFCARLRNTAHMLSFATDEARTAARVRAVLAYAALSYDDAASRMQGLSAATLRRIASASHPRGASRDELWVIADACGLPRNWLTTDWQHKENSEAPSSKPSSLGVGNPEQRLDIIESYLSALLQAEESRSRPNANS